MKPVVAASIQLSLVALIVVAIGIATIAVALGIPEPMGASMVGPRSVPIGVGLLIVACGLVLLLEARKGTWECEAVDAEAPSLDLVSMGILATGMLVNVAIIKTAGFIIAATVMYVFTARAFGARRLWLAALVGFLLALATYYGFARLLDLRIGGGWIEDLL